METYDELRLQQLLSPFNNQGINNGIMGIDEALPFKSTVEMNKMTNNNQNYPELIQQLIENNKPLENPFAGYNMEMSSTGPYNFNPQINNQVSQVNNQVPFNDYYGPNIDTSFGVANEEDEEQEFSLKDSLSNLGRKTGISSLIGMITGNPILGLIGKGIGALKERSDFVGPKGSTGYGNDSAMSLFRRSNTGAQFFQGLRDRRARKDAAARGAAKANMADARSITDRINTGPTERGPNENTGGGGSFGTSSNNNDSFSDYS